MAASTGDKVTDTRNAARPNSAKVSSGRSADGSSLACDNLTGWPTASKVHFVTYKIDSSSTPIAGSQLDCTGIVSGNNIGSLVVVDGNDTGNAVNDVVEMLPTAAWGQDLADALTAQHSRTGTHKSITNTGGITTDTLAVSGAASLTSLAVSGASTHTGATTLTGAVSGTGYDLKTIANSYKFRVYLASATNSASGNLIIPFDTKVFDTGTNVDIVTHKGRFTAPIAGFYFFSAGSAFSGAQTSRTFLSLYKNGSEDTRGNDLNETSAESGMHVSGLLQLAAGDFVEVNFNAGGVAAIGASQAVTYFHGFLVSAT